MKTLNVDKLIAELDEVRTNYAMNEQFSFTVNESAVISHTVDLIIEAIKESVTHANIVIEEGEE